MRITAFSSRDLNGYLTFDLQFHKDLNFLIGINGSGKTSVLKAIVACLSPDLDWIMTSIFKEISLSFEQNGHIHKITLNRADASTLIQYTDETGRSIPFRLTYADYQQLQRSSEEVSFNEDGERIRIRENKALLPLTVEAIRRIAELPSPLFLGLDRTSLPSQRPAAQKAYRNKRMLLARRPHSTLRTYLDESIAQAEILATEAVSVAYRERQQLAVQLRQDILLTFFSAINQSTDGSDLPRSQDIRRYERVRMNVKKAFSVLGIPTSRIESTIDPFFSGVIGTATKVSRFKNIQEALNVAPDEPEPDIYKWFSIQPRLELISRLEVLINKFNDAERGLFAYSTKYLSIMNAFFNDSRKTVGFKDDGSLYLKLPGRTENADIYFMSSGERQLFVLVTALMFNEDKSQANMLIVDEPELSLHLKWQEMFVDSLRDANPETQLILATHSPSIILDRDDKCVDLA